MLDTCGYKYAIRIHNGYRFSTATMVARKRRNVTLYEYYMCFLTSCYVFHLVPQNEQREQ